MEDASASAGGDPSPIAAVVTAAPVVAPGESPGRAAAAGADAAAAQPAAAPPAASSADWQRALDAVVPCVVVLKYVVG
jgi:hypothetical protein